MGAYSKDYYTLSHIVQSYHQFLNEQKLNMEIRILCPLSFIVLKNSYAVSHSQQFCSIQKGPD